MTNFGSYVFGFLFGTLIGLISAFGIYKVSTPAVGSYLGICRSDGSCDSDLICTGTLRGICIEK